MVPKRLQALFTTLYGHIALDELPRIMWLSALLCCIIGGFWLLDSLKDTVLATTVGLEHQPLSRDGVPGQRESVVAIFREPRQRILSSYYWLKRKSGRCCGWDWGWTNSVSDDLKRKIRAGASPRSTVAHFKGCMTAMVTGGKCMAGARLSAAARIS